MFVYKWAGAFAFGRLFGTIGGGQICLIEEVDVIVFDILCIIVLVFFIAMYVLIRFSK